MVLVSSDIHSWKLSRQQYSRLRTKNVTQLLEFRKASCSGGSGRCRGSLTFPGNCLVTISWLRSVMSVRRWQAPCIIAQSWGLTSHGASLYTGLACLLAAGATTAKPELMLKLTRASLLVWGGLLGAPLSDTSASCFTVSLFQSGRQTAWNHRVQKCTLFKKSFMTKSIWEILCLSFFFLLVLLFLPLFVWFFSFIYFRFLCSHAQSACALSQTHKFRPLKKHTHPHVQHYTPAILIYLRSFRTKPSSSFARNLARTNSA